MSVIKAVERMKQITDETTTSDMIAYLPSGFVPVQAALKTLSRMKKKWKINIVSDSKLDGYNVSFEDALVIAVPKLHWADFNERILKRRTIAYEGGRFEISLGHYLKEAKDDEMDKNLKRIDDAVKVMLVKEPLRSVGTNLDVWSKTFNRVRFSTDNNVLLKFESIDKDVKNLQKLLKTSYGDDVGFSSMIANTIEEQRPLGGLDVFDKYEFLAGTRVESNYQGIKISYESLVDMNFVPRAHIIVSDEEVLDELDVKGIKIATNTVFPLGKHFDPKVFEALKTAIDDKIESDEEEEEKND